MYKHLILIIQKNLKKGFLSAPYMNAILRLLLKIKSYVCSPHSLLHNGLVCVQSLPPSLQPSKSSIYLCPAVFAL